MNKFLKQKRNIFILCAALISFGIKANQPSINDFKSPNHSHKVENPTNEDLVFMGENGKKVSLKELKGKVVFVNLWATWCGPCVEEMPTINNLKNKFNGNSNIVFVLLDVEGNIAKSKKFMKGKNYDLPVYIAGKKIPSEYFQGAIPTTLIFNKNGELEANIKGGTDFDRPEVYEFLKNLTEK
ncbi:TlpA disulfide reductase family protein [Chryseobacterium sp. ERMR1:04]|uniref:TlpA family protein disulfide reductase n=1 Tax=Chryseobacterium sp. ERMR1:04 TaxID=1705393 RepID=UPI0006C8918B|nr:TlpA disulfide reductase family protein [Chryseobacterium sp. ERMR1:04]KPH14676.1 hypothetical protein AMQ68_04280 [Chryseobacterium sp. ERMR1:04]